MSRVQKNDALTSSSKATASTMNWAAESMPHEYQVRETADLSGLDGPDFAELKRLNDKVVSACASSDPASSLIRPIDCSTR
jgi:hypothetical protein